MYQNKVTLIGFLGNDAEVRTANNRSFTTLSLATKSSYKDKKSSEYVSHTEWHRCVVFGKLSEFAWHAEERRSCPGGRRAAQPGIRQQEDGNRSSASGRSG